MFNPLIREVESRFNLNDQALPLMQMLLAHITREDTGGLAGFIEKFKHAGLGGLVNSWIGGARPQVITPQQVEQLMGEHGGLIATLNTKLGIEPPAASSALAFLLPPVVAKLTPHGTVPTQIPRSVLGFFGADSHPPTHRMDAIGNSLVTALPWVLGLAAALLLLKYGTASTDDVAHAAKGFATATVDASKAVAAAATTASGASATAVAEAGKAAAEAIPTGAGVLTAVAGGVPTVKVYFDTGKTALSPDFSDKSKSLVDYLKANAAAKAVVSGFNDPTGHPAANAELSKNRALAVAAALKATGIAADRVVVEKPAATSLSQGDSNAEARRVEISIRT